MIYGWTAARPDLVSPTVVLEGPLRGLPRQGEPRPLAAAIAAHVGWKPEPRAFAPAFDAPAAAGRAMLFPGQGVQKIGMLEPYVATPGVIDMFDKASKIFGIDLLDVVANGPAETLDDTRYSQVCVFLTSMAAVKTLELNEPEAVAQCAVTAGFSLGEYSALVFAGVMDLGRQSSSSSAARPWARPTRALGHDDGHRPRGRRPRRVVRGTDVTIANQMFPGPLRLQGRHRRSSRRQGAERGVGPSSSQSPAPSTRPSWRPPPTSSRRPRVSDLRAPTTVYRARPEARGDGVDSIKRRMKAAHGRRQWHTIDHIGDLDAFYEPAPGKRTS